LKVLLAQPDRLVRKDLLDLLAQPVIKASKVKPVQPVIPEPQVQPVQILPLQVLPDLPAKLDPPASKVFKELQGQLEQQEIQVQLDLQVSKALQAIRALPVLLEIPVPQDPRERQVRLERLVTQVLQDHKAILDRLDQQEQTAP
jgi:hypothetical protein